MGTTALRQLLRSLCNNSPWKYALFWKLRHGNTMVLTWEDGYIDYPKPREPAEIAADDSYTAGAADVHSSLSQASASGASLGGCPIGLVVAEMSRLQYHLGEGVVGKVAFTGDHCWVSFSNISSKLDPEVSSRIKIFFKKEEDESTVNNTNQVQFCVHGQCPEEWILQFASGIKTILLVPVLPQGVLQLGSLEEAVEDIEMVTNVRCRFDGLYTVGTNTTSFTLKRDSQPESSSLLMSSAMEHVTAQLSVASIPVKSECSNDSDSIASFNLDKGGSLSTLNQTVPGGLQCEFQSENKIAVAQINPSELSTTSESITASQLEMMENKLFELSSLMEELQSYTDYDNYIIEMFGESLNEIMNLCPAGEVAGQPSRDRANDITDNKCLCSSLRFPSDSELHEALGPAFQRQTSNNLGCSTFLAETCSSSGMMSSNLADRNDPSWFGPASDGEYLLDAVVANAYCASDDSFFNRSNSFKCSGNPELCFGPSPPAQYQCKASAGVVDGVVTQSYVTSEPIVGGSDKPPSASLKIMMSTGFDGEEQARGYSQIQAQKGQKTPTVAKRRARPGDGLKPRPRDRQLIQDRVKELRELVPNGAKCSIDGLLDRTIKHMLYLRSVTELAAKLNQWVHQEVSECKIRRSSRPKDNSQNGSSWAFEFGSEPQECPIFVQDLAYPGHMLIEMLCNEQSLFLEIAQVIRGLELTILKGVMESKSNDTWAHFIVETSKGFHRLDIFWPLMQLLQRKRNSISSKI